MKIVKVEYGRSIHLGPRGGRQLGEDKVWFGWEAELTYPLGASDREIADGVKSAHENLRHTADVFEDEERERYEARRRNGGYAPQDRPVIRVVPAPGDLCGGSKVLYARDRGEVGDAAIDEPCPGCRACS